MLVADKPLTENMIWKFTTSPSEIHDKGVEVKPPNYPEPYMYVCAVPQWGPGKLVSTSLHDVYVYPLSSFMHLITDVSW